MSRFKARLADSAALIFDGATGTMLAARGMPPGASPEAFGLERPDVLESVARDYIAAGADVVTTNTFGATRFKLPAGLSVNETNERIAAAYVKAARASGREVFVAGSVGPSGKFVKPLGEVSLADMIDAYAEQIVGLVKGGVDLILGETHFDLHEAKAVVMAAKRVAPEVPVGLTMTFEGETSLTGTAPEAFAAVMENLGVDFLGVNCGMGPEQMEPVVLKLLASTDLPILAQPNAGLPELIDGQTVFRLPPAPFAEKTARFAALGVKLVGGCCGSTPDHIAALAHAAKKIRIERTERGSALKLASRRSVVEIGFSVPFAVIAERINPTGKKALTADLQAGSIAEALKIAQTQIEEGAPILDVNVGAPLIDETVLLPELVAALIGRFSTPLALDSANIEAVEAALPLYPGSPLVNSISGEPGKMERLAPLCKAHGAPFILLPLEGRKLPVAAKDRIAIIEKLYAQALDMGVPKRLILVDALALTVSSKPEAARECLKTIAHCRDVLGLPTTLGLSNTSFGLPRRDLVNAAFAAMAMAHGLCSAIADPGSASLRQALAASETLLGRDPNAGRWIAAHVDAPGPDDVPLVAKKAAAPDTLKDKVVKGDKAGVLALVEEGLAQGRAPKALVDEELIPGITAVGEFYERKTYFLPQLLLSAEAMQAGFDRIKPLLTEDSAEKKAVIVMATVEGDIHDIGKNIVCLMLKNHGFTVVDLGKDVTAQVIVEAAKSHNAAVVGLSALMTTTMPAMRDVVELAKSEKLAAKILVGGAVVTQDFAERIGADGYAPDAVAAVKLAASFI